MRRQQRLRQRREVQHARLLHGLVLSVCVSERVCVCMWVGGHVLTLASETHLHTEALREHGGCAGPAIKARQEHVRPVQPLCHHRSVGWTNSLAFKQWRWRLAVLCAEAPQPHRQALDAQLLLEVHAAGTQGGDQQPVQLLVSQWVGGWVGARTQDERRSGVVRCDSRHPPGERHPPNLQVAARGLLAGPDHGWCWQWAEMGGECFPAQGRRGVAASPPA
jgi:hypothetical protein